MTSLFLGGTDHSSGVHKIYYSFNGGKETDYSTPLVLDHDGTFDLTIRADDNLGNQSSKHVKFVVHELSGNSRMLRQEFECRGLVVVSWRCRIAGGADGCLRSGAELAHLPTAATPKQSRRSIPRSFTAAPTDSSMCRQAFRWVWASSRSPGPQIAHMATAEDSNQSSVALKEGPTSLQFGDAKVPVIADGTPPKTTLGD